MSSNSAPVPASADRAELRGEITAIRWQCPEGSGRSIIEVRSKDGAFTSVIVTFPGEPRGWLKAEVQVIGRWRHHEKFGAQILADGIVRVEPRTRDGIVRYLRETLGVDGGLANKLYTRFREQTPEVMRATPAAVAETGLVDDERASRYAQTLRRMFLHQEAYLSLSGLFAGKRMPIGIIQVCIDRWGNRAPDIVRRDPYLLLTIPGYVVSFARADNLYLELGGDPARLKRQMLFVLHAVAMNREGHTWMRAVALGEELAAEMQKRGRGAQPRIVDAIKLGLRAKLLATHRDETGQLWITTSRDDRDERQLAAKVLRLLTEYAPLGSSTSKPPAAVGDKQHIPPLPGTEPHNWEDYQLSDADEEVDYV